LFERFFGFDEAIIGFGSFLYHIYLHSS